MTGATGAQGDRGLTWRGAWNIGTGYVADDAVISEGSAWIAMRVNTGVTPAEGADWTLLASKGDTGPQGSQGSQGVQGPTGAQGPQGIQGPTGPQGSQGDPGATGPTGSVGPQGPQGNQGPTGATGAQGDRGLTWRGAWNSGAGYVADDAVLSDGSAWLALQASMNQTPVEGAN